MFLRTKRQNLKCGVFKKGPSEPQSRIFVRIFIETPNFLRIDDSLKNIIQASSENKMCHTNGGFKG